MLPRTDHVIDQVDDFLHELLNPADAAHVERHCQVCETCKAALAEARKRLAALESLPMSEPSEQLIQSTVDRIDHHEKRRRRRRRLLGFGVAAALAACIAIIGSLHVYYLNMMPSPIDVKVLGQTVLMPGSQGSLRVRVIDRNGGRPMANQQVTIGLKHKEPQRWKDPHILLVNGMTDAEGNFSPRFTVPDMEAEFDLEVTANVGGQTETVKHTVRLKRSSQVMLSSDKPVYQPGQMIHLRSLSLRKPDLKPVAASDAVFTVADPKGNVVFKQKSQTSQYGIASADCQLADEILEGSYTLTCAVGDTSSKQTVEVKKYVLPKFKVAIALDRPYYTTGQKVQITVVADYFFGKAVEGGTVRLEVDTPEMGDRVIHKLDAKCDASGKAIVTFDHLKNFMTGPQDADDDRVSISAVVTDKAGQEQSARTSALVTTRPLRLEVIPEGGSVVPGQSTRFYVLATYADGRPAEVTLGGDIPLEDALTTDKLGIATYVDHPTPNNAQYVRKITAKDKDGLSTETTVRLTPSNLPQDFLLRTDKATYEGGDSMTLTVIGGAEPVFVDLLKDGQTQLTETIPIRNGHGSLTIDLPPEAFGTLLLCAYRMNADGIPIRKTRTLYVSRPGALTVKATLDREEYRPGRKAKVKFELLDKDGKPTPGALSLAAVDEAVFAVLQQRPGMEGRFFMLEEELLKPVYAIYPWSPDQSGPDREMLNQALFARTIQNESSQQMFSAGSHHIEGLDWVEEVTIPQPRIKQAPGASNVQPHTLAVSSYVDKSSEVARTQRKGLDRVKLAWILLGVGVVVLAYVGMWVFVRPMWVITVLHGIGLAFLFGGLCVMSTMFFGMKSSKSMARMEAAGGMAPEFEDVKKSVREKAEPPDGKGTDGGTHVRKDFPETLFWKPQLITDDQGRVTQEIDLADSITTWRLSASAVTTDGRLGATQAGIRVFQPFFVDLHLPVTLTRGDEVSIPVVVYNYLPNEQTVTLTLAAADWFENREGMTQTLKLAPREVRSVSYPLRVKKVGKHALEITAKGSDMEDAVKREIEVVPDGRRVDQVVNGILLQPADTTLIVPNDAIEGSPKATLKIYPSAFSQLVEGLDGIFQRPYGCFEQTSSTTYPNVLALTYLQETHKDSPEVAAKARQYIHLGYQRLLGFEVVGGGFDWFGRPPANRTLTAYGLLEFRDMAKVHDVDPNLIERTRNWLLRQQRSDGSWEAESHGMHDDPAVRTSPEMSKLSTTAYIAWAVFSGESGASANNPTRQFLLSHKADSLDDPYVVALMCNALHAIDPTGKDAEPYLDRLEKLSKTVDDGKLVYWEQPTGRRTAFYGAGKSGSVETTALVALALRDGKRHALTGRALAWIVKEKGPNGSWGSTQATVLALKALIAGTGVPVGDGERRIEITWDGQTQEIVIPADQAEVMKQIDLTPALKTGANRLTVTEKTSTGAGYQVAFRYHVPGASKPEKPEPLLVELKYDRTELFVNELVKTTAKVTNRMAGAAPMVILDLPIPAGFVVDADDFTALVRNKVIEKFQVTPRSVVVYLRGIDAGKSVELSYRLGATMPVKVAVPPARAYEYYDESKQGTSAGAKMTVGR